MGRYWYHAHGQNTDYNVLMDDFGDVLMYKEKLYILQSLKETILQEYHDVHGYFSQTHMQEIISEQFYQLKITHSIQKY